MPDQLLFQVMSAAGGSAPLSLGIDQVLDDHRLDEPSLSDQVHVAHRASLDALKACQGPAPTGTGYQRHVVQRLNGRPGAAAAYQSGDQHCAMAQAVLFLGDCDLAAHDAGCAYVFFHHAPAIKNPLNLVFHCVFIQHPSAGTLACMCNRYVSPEAGDMERYFHLGARQLGAAARSALSAGSSSTLASFLFRERGHHPQNYGAS